ncbi:MAG: hypothetical protein KJ970_04665 [Candidatus Eisenbacteria bacterium]|uniref:ZU5 domain-containing protein n=1 Tax=Eiseniibacteriota bacterium TaxID=2212470 RepID=A0A948RXS8_UNCEI|nr:hypothetical protein [Candidatus Eisenbacteria bacterium]MBU1950699.1 hypothetical protein [Candidatus Eisenbacteria bacterium]MBU2690199.1 hypothetical protein [Candidatus Eisenbacteria bacterium]
MQRQIKLQTVFFALVVVGICVMIVGCGNDTTTTPKTTAAPALMTVLDAPDNGISMGKGGSKDDDDNWKDRTRRGNMLMIPGVGGTLTVGRFTITVPPGAIETPIVLSITDDSRTTGYLLVQLGPHGYQFNELVTLTMNLAGTNIDDYGDATIIWYDEENDEWVDLDGVYDPKTNCVSVGLEHFSIYGGAGRSGW